MCLAAFSRVVGQVIAETEGVGFNRYGSRWTVSADEESPMSKGQSLQDPYLNALRKDRTPVSVYLVNGIKLQGQIESFDQFVVVLRNSVSQMVYKHAISTVVPSRNVRLPATEPRPARESVAESE